MGFPQWEAGVGIALALTPDAEEVPNRFLVCDTAKITKAPILYQRRPNYSPDVDHIVPAGFNYSFNASGITGSCKDLGYLLFLWAGGNTFNALRQTIFPNDVGAYCNFHVDQKLGEPIGPTKVLIGARITKLTLSQKEKAMWTWGVEGVACDSGANIAALNPTIPLGPDNAPLSWVHFQDALGYVKIGLDGGLAVQDDSIKGFEIELTRNAFPQGAAIGSNQPTDMHAGQRTVAFKFSKEFFSVASTLAQIAAFNAQLTVSIDIKAIVGVNDFQLAIPNAHFDGDPGIEVGAKDDVIMATFSAVAFKSGAQNILTGTTKDGSIAVYD